MLFWPCFGEEFSYFPLSPFVHKVDKELELLKATNETFEYIFDCTVDSQRLPPMERDAQYFDERPYPSLKFLYENLV
jgi:hypothetical protein